MPPLWHNGAPQRRERMGLGDPTEPSHAPERAQLSDWGEPCGRLPQPGGDSPELVADIGRQRDA